MKARYYDPLFYICSEEMPFTIRIETAMKEDVDPAALRFAANEAIKRYSYFAMRVVKDAEELLCVPNGLPLAVYEGPEVYALGSEQVNYHLIALSYCENNIYFYASHVITDGGGFFPFIKTILYYYLTHRYHTELQCTDLRLAGEPLFDDEVGNPYPEKKMKTTSAFYKAPKKEFFRLSDGGYVNDENRTVYRFRVNEKEVMAFNHDNDASPCALVSSLMTKAVWELHPDEKRDIVSAVSFNLRPGLENRHNFRMLCSAIELRYPVLLKGAETSKLCTCSRGMTFLQSQSENVIAYAAERKKRFENLEAFKTLREKQAFVGRYALEDSVNNTFSVSYVGKTGLGDIEPYIDSMYNLTDGSTYKTVFIEISSMNGQFDIAFIQGFSSDVYYRAFLRQLDACGLGYEEDFCGPLKTPKIILP